MKPIGLIIPTLWEARPVMKTFGFTRRGAFYEGVIAGLPVRLSLSGVGPVKARAAAEALCASGIRVLVSAGFCGALHPGIATGTLFFDRVATSPCPVRTPQERLALSERANALAVDMETQAIIEGGTRRGVPIRVIRVVSDTFDDNLEGLLGPGVNFSPWAIAWRLLNPRAWPLARRLAANSRVARARLIEALQAALPTIHLPADALRG